ncbi:MAG: biotin/lipoyl-binding protein [Chloroflexi bacterium]|nr:biotin/lipoyl-binding protein [Chloroflexota bacterium]
MARSRPARRQEESAVRRVLVANRSEIALRVMRACHELELETVAVYDEAEGRAPHVRYAGAAVAVPTGDAGRPYLNAAGLIEAARQVGADAIYPGYGFLAESPAFARAVHAAGLTWVGPPAAAIAIMGDKVAARALAHAAGVPIVPGSAEALGDWHDVLPLAEEWGYPVAIKAAGGGGGRGFRVARGPDEVRAAVEGATREAELFFGNAAVYAERYIERPRHVEVQVLFDSHGAGVHLGERDCSVQRRHQKLIEEAPSPAVDGALRATLGETALRLARAAAYVSAGTVEFLLAPDGRFYFLEMNTRIQVEHTVTEMVTGIDLVKAQLRIAAGAPLGIEQAAVVWRGHAIQVRVNAEDAGADFRPTPGRISEYSEPTGFGIRVDAGVGRGDAISPRYDSLVAKLIAWGEDRPEALARLRRALHDYRIEGVPTTIPFHQRVLANPVFQAGAATTDFLEREDPTHGLAPAVPPNPDDERAATTYEVEVNGRPYAVRVYEPRTGSGAARRPDARRRTSDHAAPPGAVISPIQGTVVKIAVADGQHVARGEVLLVVEAMKMENEIIAPAAGTVAELAVAVGATVQVGAVLVRLDA